MTHLATARSALADAGSHPVTAAVNSLALVIGVAATVLALAVGFGAKRAAVHSFQGLDPDEVAVTATSPSSSGVEVGLPSASLTRDDVQALSDKGFVPDGVAVAPTAGLRTDVLSLARSWTTDVIGSTPDFSSVRGYTIAQGRFLTAADVAAAAPVAVVGQTVVQRLFNGDNPVGQQVQIDSRSLEVVGVFSARGFSGAFDQDDLIVIPITTAWSDLLANNPVIDQVLIQAASPARAGAVKAEATATLLQRHGFTNPADADFEVHTLKDLTAEEEKTAAAVKHILVLAAVALLLVAGIDRGTREGGPADLLASSSQFPANTGSLPAAVVRAVIATVIGIAVAAGSLGAVRHLIGGIPPPQLRLSALAWGGGIGVAVGVAAWFSSAVGGGRIPRLRRLPQSSPESP